MVQASKHNNYHYNNKLRDKAAELRKNATKAEACLWKYILKANGLGYSFRRQRPVLNYIADFMSKDLMLIVEVDGITHSYEGAKEKDSIRQSNLEKAGFTVLRYTDEEVLGHINAVREGLLDWIDAHAKVPPPSPRQRGKRRTISPSLRGLGGGVPQTKNSPSVSPSGQKKAES